MFRNNLKIAYRNLVRKKGYTFINITGLAIGMACCIMIALYVNNELSYDKYHKNLDRTYRILHAFRNGEDPKKMPPPAPTDFQVWGNAPVGRDLKDDFPEIETFTRFTSPVKFLINYEEKTFQEENVLFMDSTAFEIFSWKILAGNPETALVEPGSMVITESIAKKYFGHTDVLGETFTIDEEKNAGIVTAVIEDLPDNSHFTFEMLISMSTFYNSAPEIFESYGYVDFYTYFLLDEKADISSLKAKVPDFIDKYVTTGMVYTIDFEPMNEAYLNSVATRQPGPTGNQTHIYVFLSIAAFILLIACINFINLSTARSLERAREVGIRKSVGAVRSGLIKQFLMESIVLAVIAAGLALVLAEFSLPVIREISGKNISQQILTSPLVVSLVLGIALVVGMAAGSYPAWVLSGFRPAAVLKGNLHGLRGGVTLRKALVVFQFSLSMILIAGTGIVFMQLEHLQNQDLGFQKEQMLIIDFGYDDKVQENIQAIKHALSEHPKVLSVAASRAVPGDFLPNAYTRLESPEGETIHGEPLIYEVDFDFIPTFGIEMAAGRPFSTEFPSDSMEALIINEAAIREYGYQHPEVAIGKEFSQWGRNGFIIGVVKDFNFQSLHGKVMPLTIRSSQGVSKFSLKIKGDRLPFTVSELQGIWSSLVPHRPFLYSFLDSDLDSQYKSDMRFGQIFMVFAGLAILIACLGLFGLATYTAEQRTKEIGIRKVLGATVTNIVALLSKDFAKLVLISIIIATPVTWYLMQNWLDDFAYRTEVGPEIFFISGMIAMVIALATVSWQSVKAALTNPVKSLKSE